MKIDMVLYNPGWKADFESLKKELAGLTGSWCPQIEHIGSTSVEGLAAKPIIDVLIGVKHADDLDQIPHVLMDQGYIYYERYNTDMPYRRFFVKLQTDPALLSLPVLIRKDDPIPVALNEHRHRLAHIHILPLSSEHWTRHIAFRDYLRTHPDVKAAYQQLKEQLAAREWNDGNAYNEAKDTFLKTEERNAVNWYLQNRPAS
ncbi:GrpB family protein [Niabella sp. CC-SYL272]|uniref:GrpB family protein n=1 Tax=Niabella agricola TaxID=2891571 RepID=UPI001F3AFF1F|nr:GrpB family protein [Niabella agricola]MCF3107193.1 GrpB family protein [Niabella agricola]